MMRSRALPVCAVSLAMRASSMDRRYFRPASGAPKGRHGNA